MLFGAHFLPERGGGGWNPRHSFLQAVLLSAAQFAGQPLLYRLLSCTQFRGAGVGIPRTVYGGRGCYRQHNFGAVCIAGQKKMVVIGRTIRTFFCGRQVVIHSTICAVGKIRLLLSAAHFGISSAFQTCPDRVVIQHTFPAVGLLSGAQFPNCRILAAVVIDGTFLKKSTVQRIAGIVIHGTIRFFRGRAVVIRRTIRKNPFFLRRVLPWVVSLRTVCPAGAGVVIDGTIQGFFSTGCYSAHISPRQDFSIRPVGMLRTFLTFPFFAPGVVILDTFLKSYKIFFAAIFLQKNFFTVVTLRTLLRFTHLCWNAAHSTVVTQRTFVLEYST